MTDLEKQYQENKKRLDEIDREILERYKKRDSIAICIPILMGLYFLFMILALFLGVKR